MPIHIEMSLVGLTLSFDQRRVFLDKTCTNLVRSSLHQHSNHQPLINILISVVVPKPVAIRSNGKHAKLFVIQSNFNVMGFSQAFNVFVAIS